MRPVERGTRPLDSKGKPKTYKKYADAKRDLIDRMGQYCSYCNQKLPTSLAVEHVQPKDPVPELKLEWTNFLLGCTNCNSTKNAKPIVMDNYLWPDIHNTHLAYCYNEDGTVAVNPNLDEPTRQKAQNMLDLVGLQKYPDTPSDSDRRWKNRKDAYLKVNAILDLYERAAQKGAEEEFVSAIEILAPETGFFSIWIKVFNSYPKVKKAIVESFTGTAVNAFDGNLNAIRRTATL